MEKTLMCGDVGTGAMAHVNQIIDFVKLEIETLTRLGKEEK